MAGVYYDCEALADLEMNLMRRHKDWMKQAHFDLEHAKISLEAGHYEWACFASQQSAEMAIKALYQSQGDIAWGHSVHTLLANLDEKRRPTSKLINDAKVLDRHYVPSRYPNGLPSGTPRSAFSRNDSEEAIRIAQRIIEFCENMARHTT